MVFRVHLGNSRTLGWHRPLTKGKTASPAFRKWGRISNVDNEEIRRLSREVQNTTGMKRDDVVSNFVFIQDTILRNQLLVSGDVVDKAATLDGVGGGTEAKGWYWTVNSCIALEEKRKTRSLERQNYLEHTLENFRYLLFEFFSLDKMDKWHYFLHFSRSFLNSLTFSRVVMIALLCVDAMKFDFDRRHWFHIIFTCFNAFFRLLFLFLIILLLRLAILVHAIPDRRLEQFSFSYYETQEGLSEHKVCHWRNMCFPFLQVFM